jgi:nephrocystin-3
MNEFRIFLSSTFKDLQPEREQLIKKVFPQIRALCRERGVDFTEIDLRWGITDEEARSGKIIRICLEEIDKCRPYFLGILGSRYGWRPQISDIETDEELLKIYPWLRKFAADNKSIVELEFTYGALQSQDEGSAFFYESAAANDDRIKEEDKILYNNLKKTLRDSGLLDFRFDTPEELGEKVLRDLTAILDRDFPVKKEQTPAERERNPHEAFARNRTHSYIANPEYYERFEKFIESNESPLILWGKSGFGKSALMAHLTNEYRHNHSKAFIIRHFVGATAGASSTDDIMRHLMLEIKEHYKLSDELPQSNLQEELPVWLAKIPEGEKLVLAIDAVNQLTGIGNEMHWLPEFIPANVRLIISTTPELPLEQLRKRNWQELEIKPLSSGQRKRIAEEFLARYHKRLHKDQLEIIANEPKLESPLFLRTVLEELRIFGVHSALDMHLASYLACESEPDLFQTVLARMERDHGRETVRRIMSAIWASRYGLSETELLEITGLSRLTLSEFLIALEFHLMQRTGLFTFFHSYLRSAVELRYLHEEGGKKDMHRHLAAYFSEEPYDERRRDEEPWQWQQSENLETLRECLMQPEMAAQFSTDQQAYEALFYWKSLPEIGFDTSYLDKLKSRDRGLETNFQAYKNIINLLITAGNYANAAVFLEKGFTEFDGRVEENKTLEINISRAELEMQLGKYDTAIGIAQSLLETKASFLEKNHSLRLKLLDTLSTTYYNLGKFEEAENIVRDEINTSKNIYGILSIETAIRYRNLGAILMMAKKFQDSENICRETLSLYINLFGERYPDTIFCRINLGSCLHLQRKFENAAHEFEIAEQGLSVLLGSYHQQTLICQNNIANLLAEQGKFEEARVKAFDVLERRINTLGEKSLDTAITGMFIGYTYYLEKKYKMAKRYYEKYLPIHTKIQGEQNPNVIRFQARLEEINRALLETSAQ